MPRKKARKYRQKKVAVVLHPPLSSHEVTLAEKHPQPAIPVIVQGPYPSPVAMLPAVSGLQVTSSPIVTHADFLLNELSARPVPLNSHSVPGKSRAKHAGVARSAKKSANASDAQHSELAKLADSLLLLGYQQGELDNIKIKCLARKKEKCTEIFRIMLEYHQLFIDAGMMREELVRLANWRYGAVVIFKAIASTLADCGLVSSGRLTIGEIFKIALTDGGCKTIQVLQQEYGALEKLNFSAVQMMRIAQNSGGGKTIQALLHACDALKQVGLSTEQITMISASHGGSVSIQLFLENHEYLSRSGFSTEQQVVYFRRYYNEQLRQLIKFFRYLETSGLEYTTRLCNEYITEYSLQLRQPVPFDMAMFFDDRSLYVSDDNDSLSFHLKGRDINSFTVGKAELLALTEEQSPVIDWCEFLARHRQGRVYRFLDEASGLYFTGRRYVCDVFVSRIFNDHLAYLTENFKLPAEQQDDQQSKYNTDSHSSRQLIVSALEIWFGALLDKKMYGKIPNDSAVAEMSGSSRLVAAETANVSGAIPGSPVPLSSHSVPDQSRIQHAGVACSAKKSANASDAQHSELADRLLLLGYQQGEIDNIKIKYRARKKEKCTEIFRILLEYHQLFIDAGLSRAQLVRIACSRVEVQKVFVSMAMTLAQGGLVASGKLNIQQVFKIAVTYGGSNTIRVLQQDYGALEKMNFSAGQMMRIVQNSGGGKTIQTLLRAYHALKQLGLSTEQIARICASRGGSVSIRLFLENHEYLSRSGFSNEQQVSFFSGYHNGALRRLIKFLQYMESAQPESIQHFCDECLDKYSLRACQPVPHGSAICNDRALYVRERGTSLWLSCHYPGKYSFLVDKARLLALTEEQGPVVNWCQFLEEHLQGRVGEFLDKQSGLYAQGQKYIREEVVSAIFNDHLDYLSANFNLKSVNRDDGDFEYSGLCRYIRSMIMAALNIWFVNQLDKRKNERILNDLLAALIPDMEGIEEAQRGEAFSLLDAVDGDVVMYGTEEWDQQADVTEAGVSALKQLIETERGTLFQYLEVLKQSGFSEWTVLLQYPIVSEFSHKAEKVISCFNQAETFDGSALDQAMTEISRLKACALVEIDRNIADFREVEGQLDFSDLFHSPGQSLRAFSLFPPAPAEVDVFRVHDRQIFKPGKVM